MVLSQDMAFDVATLYALDKQTNPYVEVKDPLEYEKQRDTCACLQNTQKTVFHLAPLIQDQRNLEHVAEVYLAQSVVNAIAVDWVQKEIQV